MGDKFASKVLCCGVVKTYFRSPYHFSTLRNPFFFVILAELEATSTDGTAAKAAKVKWTPYPQAEYYVVNITESDDDILDDIVFVGAQTSLEIHYNTLVAKKTEKKPKEIKVCPVVTAISDSRVLAKFKTCLSKCKYCTFRYIYWSLRACGGASVAIENAKLLMLENWVMTSAYTGLLVRTGREFPVTYDACFQ